MDYFFQINTHKQRERDTPVVSKRKGKKEKRKEKKRNTPAQ